MGSYFEHTSRSSPSVRCPQRVLLRAKPPQAACEPSRLILAETSNSLSLCANMTSSINRKYVTYHYAAVVGNYTLTATTTTTAVLRPLYSSACVNININTRHLQLRTGGFCWCKVSLPARPCIRIRLGR